MENIFVEYYNGDNLINTTETTLKDVNNIIESAHIAAIHETVVTEKSHVLYAIMTYNEDNSPNKLMIFKNSALSDAEMDDYIAKYPNSRFYAIHSYAKAGCEKILQRRKRRTIRPITLKEANTFVTDYHRHHGGTAGCKFSLGLYEGDILIGVAICGRPVSRFLDNGMICEINRLCTRGGKNACSMLYGACCRVAKDMGYEKIITYILQSESGASLKASNFTCEGEAGGTYWTGKRNKGQNLPHEMKTRWSRQLV